MKFSNLFKENGFQRKTSVITRVAEIRAPQNHRNIDIKRHPKHYFLLLDPLGLKYDQVSYFRWGCWKIY